MFELFSFKKCIDLFIKFLFIEVNQFYFFSKRKKKTVPFNYSFIIEFAYVYQVTTSLARTGIFLQNKLHISKLLIIMSFSMFDMQY